MSKAVPERGGFFYREIRDFKSILGVRASKGKMKAKICSILLNLKL
jgi:hypothetical protein